MSCLIAGDRFATLSGDTDANPGEAKMWDRSGHATLIRDNAKGLELHAHSQGLTNAAFSVDGQYIVTTSYDNTARVWKVQDGSLVRALEGHSADVLSASFSDSGEYVATSSMDRTAIVWRLNSPGSVAVLAHQKPVNQALFTCDSRYLVTASHDGATRIWDFTHGGLLVAIKRQAGLVFDMGYAGAGVGSTIGIVSLTTPTQPGEADRQEEDDRPTPRSPEYRVEVGLWDLSPTIEPAVESLLHIGEAAAARIVRSVDKVGLEDLSSGVNPEVLSPGEVKLKAIDLFNTWRMTKTTKDLLGPPAPIAQWHDRMAALFEAKRRWAAAAWHLGRLIDLRPNDSAVRQRKAEAYLNLALVEPTLKATCLDQAIPDLNLVLKSDPKNWRACVLRARFISCATSGSSPKSLSPRPSNSTAKTRRPGSDAPMLDESRSVPKRRLPTTRRHCGWIRKMEHCVESSRGLFRCQELAEGPGRVGPGHQASAQRSGTENATGCDPGPIEQ